MVVILPQEEHINIRPITEEETIAAFKETAEQKGDHDHRVLKTMTRNVKSSFVPNLLKYRSDFENSLEEESRVDQCRLDNISVDHKGEEVSCKLCEYCNQ